MPGYLLNTGDGVLQGKPGGNWCEVKTHSQNFLLARCEISLSQVDYLAVMPFWAELRLLLLALHQRLKLAQVVLLTLDMCLFSGVVAEPCDLKVVFRPEDP